ncbi:hypothetical protein [Xenorhabdus innexi]|uniref:Uncharacterized protein n=1 Tax=Xenorhabdus innexi TaxID=290109 RepID=A0A1N6N125_9GAMM|nr:hypothetical protein [Xenorhabdus innexi]PHM31325.1 hypothetical protein Xinn_02871 [Xenorhabdus innexi]SIP74777.1 conserved hypothetical protein [Xenorhabdus innexi]
MSNTLQTAVEIAEEIETQLVPLMSEIEDGDSVDAYLMCRGIYRQMKTLAEKLRNVSGGGNNNNSLCNKLEVSASKVEGLKTYITLLLENESDKHDAHLLSIAVDQVFDIEEEIAQIRGKEL